MHRLIRSGLLLAGALSLVVGNAANAAGYLLDSQTSIASATPAAEEPLADYDAFEPAMATAAGHDRMLLVWTADDTAFRVDTDDESELRLADDEFEIVARLISTRTLASIQAKLRVSNMGDDLETDTGERQRYAAHRPAVAWNPVAEEFLVVWEGDDSTAPLVDEEFEIFAQRVSVEGEAVGDQFRISVMGNDAETDAAQRQRYGAFRPSVAVDSVTGEYLVVWQADDDAAPLVAGETEIFGRILDTDAQPKGAQFRISFTGDDTQAAADRIEYGATRPVVVFNPVAANFVVAWQADDHRDGMVNGEHEIFIQQVSNTAALVGAPLRVSQMGPDGDPAFDALSPAITVEPETGSILAVWHGDTQTSSLVDDELEVHGRLLDQSLAPVASQFRISRMGPNSETDPAEKARFDAMDPAVAWNSREDHFLVAWRGDTTSSTLVDDEFEIYGRFVNLDGSIPDSAFRISTQGGDSEEDADERTKYTASNPVLAYDASNFIAVWDGDTNLSSGRDNQLQIFGRRIAMTSATLELTRPPHPRYPQIAEQIVFPTVPEPISVRFILTNIGETVAENVRVDVGMTNEFPVSWIGCPNVTESDVCEFGDLEAEEKVEFTLVLATDHIELGDAQSAELFVAARSDTALHDSARAQRNEFVGAVVEQEGGTGTLGPWWLLLLAGIPMIANRRRDV